MPSDTTPSAENWRRRWQPLLGVLIGSALSLLITALPWPLILFNASMYAGLVDRWFTPWSIALVVTTLLIAMLAATLSRFLRPISRLALTALALAAWTVGVLSVAGGYLAGEVPVWISGAAFWLSSLWSPWLGWMFLWPIPWKSRLRVAVGLACLPILLSWLMHPTQMTGDEQLLISWRWKQESSSARVPRVTRPTGPASTPTSSGKDFPQYLGPDRTGVLSQPKLDPDWTSHPPVLVWKIPVGKGWSGFSIAGGVAYTLEQREQNETIAAYSLKDGTQQWAYAYPAHFRGEPMGSGPRSTPTVDENFVFAMGATGWLHAIDRPSGQVVWQRDVVGESGQRLQLHGSSSSPLLVDDLVVVGTGVETGPSLLACSRQDGKVRWHAGKHGPMYGSPLLLHSQNRPTLILHADAQTLYALSPTDGKPVWEWGMKLEGLIAQPLIIDGSPLRLLLAAYDLNGATMLSLPSQDGVSPQTLWTKPYLKTKFSTPVRWGSMAIGLDNGILQAIDLETGQSLWKKGRFKHGHLLLVDSLLLVLTEDGDLVLVRPDEKGMTELGRVKALEGQTWNPLALSGEYVVVRNSTEAACFRLKTLSP